MIRRWICLLLVVVSLPLAADVTFNIAGQLFGFEQPVKLAGILSIVKDKPTYWANAAVFELNDRKVEQMRAEVLTELAQLIRDTSPGSHDYKVLSRWYSEIGSWRMMRRLNITVDYDQARLNPKRNPQFNEGDYYIRLKPRTPSITLSGMVKKPLSLAFDTELTVADYVDNAELSEDAHRDYVYVLEPNGKVTKVGIAYWNRQFYQPMPGSEIFVPLQDSLFFDRIDDLNNRIAHLMIHRM